MQFPLYFSKMKVKTMNVYEIFNGDSIYHDYQPLYCVGDTNKVFAYEALLRNAAKINPESVFKSAKKANVLYKLDTYSLQKAIASFFNKKSTGYLFLNIYITTMLHPNFLLFFDSLCLLYPELPKRLFLEINETSDDDLWNIPLLKDSINTVRGFGVQFAIDDFGQGSSSIRRAIEFKPECIKLDRYFAQNLAADQNKQRFLELFYSYYGKDTLLVLEGIEKNKDLVVARQIGIHVVQGFYLGRPKALVVG
jgi:EAL domain-containing protein (putative c-di-GMP-specific phosphodiesterase class I)